MRAMHTLTLMSTAAAIFAMGATAYQDANVDSKGAAAQPEDRVAGLSFLSGSWRGTLFGQAAEEHWSAPEGRAMVGMFRLGAAGGRPLYELLLVEQDGDEVTYRLRHFRAKFAPLEDAPITLKAALIEKNKIVFEGAEDGRRIRVAYERTGPNELTFELSFSGEGQEQPRKERATFTRFDPAKP